MIRGAVQAAEELDTPIILQIAEVRLKHSPLNLMGSMMLQAAKEASVDIAVHLDHGITFNNVKKALEMGFTSVMFDSSVYPLEENIKRTKQVVKMAREYGATVEAELGMVGGSGITDEDFRRVISRGIVKVNIATASFNSLMNRVEEYVRLEAAPNYFVLNLENEDIRISCKLH